MRTDLTTHRDELARLARLATKPRIRPTTFASTVAAIPGARARVAESQRILREHESECTTCSGSDGAA